MENEENQNNEDVNPETNKDNDNGEENTKAKELEKLNEYVQQMAYMPIEPPKASERTEALAEAPKKYIVGTFADHKEHFKPKERSERVERIVKKHTPMTIENLEEFVRNYRIKQAYQEKDKKQQQIKYHETLTKLQKQCENQLMNAIVRKFAKMVSKKASSISSSSSTTSPSNVETESYQHLQNSLFCTIIFKLKIPNNQQSRDINLYKKLSTVLTDLILQGLFLAHNYSESEEKKYAGGDQAQQKGPNSNQRELMIKWRALRAARKKVHYQSRKKNCLNK
ncbi:uncharacterized protein LOC129951802 [Eupeodes corollae]|uniref:uncharacterized protein LOC129951802 n=1 Tax=Eupeodes corollae TaxID=290404 RepID=UPI0024919C6F|nr:uncharacterized protein LOC129951802 [Eupeodes corollae]